MLRLTLASIFGLLALSTQAAPPLLTQFQLNEEARTAYQLYQTNLSQKAFAYSADGKFGSSERRANEEDAARVALQACQKSSQRICQLYALNEESWQDRYSEFLRSSEASLTKLKSIQQKPLEIEGINWGFNAAQQLRRQSLGLHYPTPTQIQGITTINTPDLIQRMLKKEIVLFDAQGLSNRQATLPFAYLLDGSSNHYDSHHSIWNVRLESAFASLMAQHFPDKDQAIAVYCSSPDCWLSVNTLLQLQKQGYRQLFWYRGGMMAWYEAKLPVVKPAPALVVTY